MTAWTSGLQPSTGYYPYDPALAAYGYGAGYDLAARRKNATRESTATLKAWLNEHKKNPYPTKGEKIMLAIITKMTLTQVSTWFANARRRLKKENKMTWEPKNKTDDDDDAIISDCDDKSKDGLMMDEDKLKDHRIAKDMLHVKAEHRLRDLDDSDDPEDDDRKADHFHPPYHPHAHAHPHAHPHPHHLALMKGELHKDDCGVPLPATKPKIWSLADTAACKTPPPPPNSQQPWCGGGAPAGGGPSMGVNGFALPTASAPYSRYSGFFNGASVGSSGFPEVQTDTPPQTPPNMKLPSVAGNLIPGSCYPQGGGYPQQFAGYPATPKERHEYHHAAPPAQPPHPHAHPHPQPQPQPQGPSPEETAFKPFYKKGEDDCWDDP